MKSNSGIDLWNLYHLMYRSRTFELAVRKLWKQGLISGEMHLSMGEEAIVAGIVSQLKDGDALALDHRGTAPLLMRGVDASLLLNEFLGLSKGLGRGMGGHMHLFSPEHLAASSGIVGSSGPAGVGFALAASILRPGTVAISFFGEGALNQGMLMEAMNLAVVWNLPILFACKDNDWAITTRTSGISRGDLLKRAAGLGLTTMEADGRDVLSVWKVANHALEYIRASHGPIFLLANCAHLEGHFLGDPMLSMRRRPINAVRHHLFPMMLSLAANGALPGSERFENMKKIIRLIWEAQKQTNLSNDPLLITRRELVLDLPRLRKLELETRQEIHDLVDLTLASLEKER